MQRIRVDLSVSQIQFLNDKFNLNLDTKNSFSKEEIEVILDSLTSLLCESGFKDLDGNETNKKGDYIEEIIDAFSFALYD